MKPALRRWLPAVVYAAFIFWLSSRSGLTAPRFFAADKLGHLGLYSGLGFFVCHALWRHDRRRVPLWLLAAALTTAYGVTDEYHQSFVPNRHADVRDVLADLAGGLCGAAAYLWLANKRTAA